MPPLPKRTTMRRNSPGWTTLAPDPKRRVPVPPDWLTVAERRLWRSLWRGPLGGLWDPSLDVHVLGDWFRLRRLAGADEPKGVVFAQLRAIEDRLGLSPKARAQMRVELVEAADRPPLRAGGRRDPRFPRSDRPDPRLNLTT
jgi:hypothetical protein